MTYQEAYLDDIKDPGNVQVDKDTETIFAIDP